MNILILEDDENKQRQLINVIEKSTLDIECDTCLIFTDFVAKINRIKFDLVVVDLMVPLFSDSNSEDDVSDRIVEAIRCLQCINFRTPVIAITKFDHLAEDNFSALNLCDIAVITYCENSGDWRQAFASKIESCAPKKTYDFIVVCALDQEADAFLEAGYNVGKSFSMDGISCRTIGIDELEGLIVCPPRMGLVSSAILCARAIDLFSPSLICMSGICAGIEGKANIYDVVIPDICHQHDSGKWTNEGFVPELYSVQLNSQARLRISQIIKEDDFLPSLKHSVLLDKDEFPNGSNTFNFSVCLAPTSSGSAVVASDGALESIKDQHRKMKAFEMESYALYESARLSAKAPMFFSAKAVVDNGDSQKNDNYHRVAALISAKTVYEIIKRGGVSLS